MKKIFLFTTICVLSCLAVKAQTTDQELTDKIQLLIKQSGLEEVGVYVQHLKKDTKGAL